MHEWVQSAGRLIEDHHVGTVHERLDDPDLLAVAVGQGRDAAVELEAEPLGKAERHGPVHARA